ncbi:MAG: biotin--[Oscillospiraceae bacterium]|nr:biotin--[acetyl-CoA-carboxylase] ligase [Oscillospiraceae bacterium]MBQ1804921.1 biotin--[acetyl-CoA-carboxylase] ligase [Oscillospiraceae bacterium]MBQ2223641.1 biotin--[acetyl-CoA-carboxylase] ligase [Oscillospiraceae bacterium]
MSKEIVLQLLRAHMGEYVSGEMISAQLGITRAAIWKAVSALRREGYVIEATTGRGYRLSELPDQLNEQTVRANLGSLQIVGTTLRCFDSIDSTNNYLKREAAQGAPDGMVAVADEQTGGRGRRGRSFQSPSGKGIYLSVLMRPQLPVTALMPLTGLGAVAVCNAVERVCGVRPRIKWTNDLVLGGKKLCGILTELSLEGESGALQYAIMGIGVNVLHERKDFDGEVAEIATSLALETGKSVSRAALAAAMIEELDALYTALCRGEIAPYLARYRGDCLTIGHEVQLLWQDKKEKVFALDVDDDLGLIVRRADGTLDTIRTGEVSVRGLYGYVE